MEKSDVEFNKKKIGKKISKLKKNLDKLLVLSGVKKNNGF